MGLLAIHWKYNLLKLCSRVTNFYPKTASKVTPFISESTCPSKLQRILNVNNYWKELS